MRPYLYSNQFLALRELVAENPLLLVALSLATEAQSLATEAYLRRHLS